MAEPASTQVLGQASDLTLPIYLNQDQTFGLLAQLEDGFSTLKTIKTSTADTDSSKQGVGGSIGVSNVFALLGVTLTGERSRQAESQSQKERTEERVHTPTSLFSKLRSRLIERGFLTVITSSEEFEGVISGHFVEFSARLQRSPLVETLEWFRRISDLSPAGGPRGSSGRSGNARDRSRQPAKPAADMPWIDSILRDLTEGDVIEIVGKLLKVPQATAVLSTKLDYYVNRSASEIVDGDYRVMGRVTRVVASGSEDKINLLRKTSFGPVSSEKLEELLSGLRETSRLGFNLPELYTDIEGPAIQLIPIAIYV
jgi:hypothetical protein